MLKELLFKTQDGRIVRVVRWEGVCGDEAPRIRIIVENTITDDVALSAFDVTYQWMAARSLHEMMYGHRGTNGDVEAFNSLLSHLTYWP